MRSNRRRIAGLAAAAGTLAVWLGTGCSVLGIDDYDEELERLNAARAAWEAQGIDSYSLVMQRVCFCGGGTAPVAVVVEDGQRTSVTIVETGEPVPAEFRQYYYTVDELFDFIEDAIDRKAHRIEVDYDRDRGLPLSIRIDYDENAIDEEMGFDISQFVRRS